MTLGYGMSSTGLIHRCIVFALCAGYMVTAFAAYAGDGIPVTSITIVRTPAPASGPYTEGGFTVRYGQGDNVRLTDAVAGGIALTRSSISKPNIVIRRRDNPQSSGQRQTMFFPGRVSGTNIYIEGEEATNMEAAMNNDFITSGGLDVFLNVPNLGGIEQPNNVERIDFIVPAGIDLPATAALLNEIGTIANEKHGNNTYKIAMITSLDGAGDPASYAPLALVQGNVDYGNLGRPQNASGTNMRNAYIRNAAHPSGGSNGPLGYIRSDTNFMGMSFVSFAAMGATPGQTVYGYSLFPNDMFDTSDLVGLSDAPLNTGTSVNGGDIYGGTFAIFTTPAAELVTGTGGTPNFMVTKSVEVFDPFNEGLFVVPGIDVIYSINLTNSGSASPDAGTMFMVDKLPAELEFYNADIDDAGPETDPVVFVDAGSGMSFTYATDAGYSNSAIKPAAMSDCTYPPAPGYDPNVTYVCFAPSGAMANGGMPAPSFELKFRARVK